MKNYSIIARRVYLSEVIAKGVLQQFGITDTEHDLNVISANLQEIANLNMESALKRWITVLKTDENGRPISTIPNDAQWKEDKNTFLLICGFFSTRQIFLPLQLPTLEKRLSQGPYRLTYFGSSSNIADKWLDMIISTANSFIKSIKKWEKEVGSHGESGDSFKQEFKFLNYTIKNVAGLSDSKLKPYLDVISKGTALLTSGLDYGVIRITTSKEARGNKTLAYYIVQHDEMSLQIDMKDSNPVHSFLHEMGHRLWYTKLKDSPIQAEVNKFFSDSLKKGVNIHDNHSYSNVLADIIKGTHNFLFKRIY